MALWGLLYQNRVLSNVLPLKDHLFYAALDGYQTRFTSWTINNTLERRMGVMQFQLVPSTEKSAFMKTQHKNTEHKKQKQDQTAT